MPPRSTARSASPRTSGPFLRAMLRASFRMPASRSAPNTLPVSRIATSHPRAHGCCCRSTTSSTQGCSRSLSWRAFLPSCSPQAGSGNRMVAELDIVIPVFNEGRNIVRTLSALAGSLQTPARVLICYDHPEDDTLPAIRDNPQAYAGLAVELVRNQGRGAHAAVMAGFAKSSAPYVMMYPADDDYNAQKLDAMVACARAGCDIVCASRFMPGGSMVGCPPL